jgi:hypothetical protein
MLDLIIALDNSALSEWASGTTWVYPWVNSLHATGMGFLVGTVFVLSLRVLGVGSYPIAPLKNFLFVARIAFVVNLISGFILFSIDAERFFTSPTFQVKFAFLALGVIAGVLLAKNMFPREGENSAGFVPPPKAKLYAVLALVCWSGAILAGRMTAYLP